MPYKNFNQWKFPYGLSKFRRTQQWQTFARNWLLYDCKGQDPFDSAIVIAGRLQGRHKPIYDWRAQCGDHVVCYNTRHLAMPEGEWRYRHYYHHTRYIHGRTWAPAFELHLNDPTIVLYKAVHKDMSTMIQKHKRLSMMARLHLFPDDHTTIPKEIMENIVDQIQQVQPVFKSLGEHTEDEVKKFPKITDYPDDYVIKE